MPIAGNNVETIPMEVKLGKLIEHPKTRTVSSMAVDAGQAPGLLREGLVVYVRLYGTNVPDVRAAMRAVGVEVSSERFTREVG